MATSSILPTSCLIKIYESQVDKMKFNSICGNFKRKPRDIIGDWATRRRDHLQFVLAQQTESPGNLAIRGCIIAGVTVIEQASVWLRALVWFLLSFGTAGSCCRSNLYIIILYQSL